MNNIDKQYQALLQDILDNGVTKQDRTGTGTISVFGRQIRHKMSEGFPLLTTKKMPFKTMVTELLWFLRGDTNIKFLVDNNCHIWDGDAYKAYCKIASAVEEPDYNIHVDDPNQNCTRLMTMGEFINKIKTDDEFAKEWGELGPIYGKQWRSWNKYIVKPGLVSLGDGRYNENYWDIDKPIDQIQNLINDLKTNPDSRRLMVNAYNVGELDSMVLPPCHYGFQVYTRKTTREEKITNPGKYRAISLMWNQRSVDTFLGLPFNIASYGLLLEIIAREVDMVPDELIGNLGDVHLYSNHIEQAKEQIGRVLSLTERREMVTQEMFNQIYTAGDSSTLSHPEIDQWDIPRIKTREPFPLPKLSCLDEYWYLNDVELAGEIPFAEKIEKFRPDFFKMKDYKSHPAIKAPLSN
jgi:thymidylate synthase